MKKGYVVIWALILSLLLAGCAPTSTPAPTAPPVPSSTPTSTPVPTEAPTLVPTLAAKTYTITVPANAGWFDTGIAISQGQGVAIQATGTVNTFGGAQGSDSDAKGQTRAAACDDPRCTVPGAYFGELVARVDTAGTPFRVDTSFAFKAINSGTLFLAVNDWQYPDNKGEFSVTVIVK